MSLPAVAVEALPVDLKAIAPASGPQFSPNLFKWLKASERRLRFTRVYVDQDGGLWIGELDDDCGDGPWLHGTRLMSVLCGGVKAERMAYCVPANFRSLTEVPDFWSRYAQQGRCAIDTKHDQFFVGDEARWDMRGDHRSCLWCGQVTQTLKRWTEAVERSQWT
jgi:hypothetical protein